MDTLTLISGRWMPSRLRFPLLFLLPLLLLGPSLLPGQRFLPLLPVTQEPLASEYPEAALSAQRRANRVATDRLFPILSDELAIRAQLAGGTLPTWNPDLGLGQPLAAGSLAAPWNPLRWPLLFLPPEIAGGWHALLALVVAGLGMLLFLEGRGLKFTAAFFGALAFQGSGFLVANLHYVMKVDALAWAPWCLWGVDLVYRRRKNAGLILCSGLGLSALAGFPPVFVFVALLTLAWILVRALEAIRVQREAPAWGRSLGAALGFAGLGLLAGALHLLPMWEASALSSRAPQAPAAIQAQSLPNIALATSILPTFFGTPGDPSPASRDPATWWLLARRDLGRGLVANRLEWHLFAGVTALAMVLAALCARPRQALFPALIVLCALGFVFDWPGLEFLYGLPGTNLGAPARAASLAALGLAWSAALGFDSLLEGQRSARLGALAVATACGALGLGLWWAIEPEPWTRELETLLQARHSVDLEAVREFFSAEDARRAARRVAGGGLALVGFSAAVALCAVYAGRLTVRGSGAAGCALLLVEVTVAGLPHTGAQHLGSLPLFPRSEALEAVALAAGDGRVLRVDRSESGVDEVLRLARPNLLSVYGVKDLTPYTAFPSRALAELWRDFDPQGLYRGGVARLSDPALLEAPLLDLLRVTCVLSTEALVSPVLVPRYERAGFHVYHRQGALPGARVVGDIRVELDLQRPAPHRIDVRARGSTGGKLVVHEGWAPGWKATVNGQDAEVYPMDRVYFGVELPAGDSIVRFKYEPWSLRLGALLSILAVLLALGFTVLRHRAGPSALERHELPHAPASPR